jgi:hypothetical protein
MAICAAAKKIRPRRSKVLALISLSVLSQLVQLQGMPIRPFLTGETGVFPANATMTMYRVAALILLAVTPVTVAYCQDMKAVNPAAVPPNLLQFVRRDLLAGRENDQQKVQTTLSRKCDQLGIPYFWIESQSVTGSKEVTFFEPFDSFEHLQDARTAWNQLYASHPDLARARDDMNSLVGSERTIIAYRRDDLSHLLENIDLSEARFLRLVEVRLFPGHDRDFAEAIELVSESRAKSDADAPWVAYQVTLGASAPTFLVFSPMADLKQDDDILAQLLSVIETAETDHTKARDTQIAREAFASAETNLYAINPEMSHVSGEFAAGDFNFWKRPAEQELKGDPQSEPIRPKKKNSAKSPRAIRSAPN